MAVEVALSGEVYEKFQVHLNLTEETATVDEVQKLLEQQLGLAVILLDAKHLPVMSGENTKGKEVSFTPGQVDWLCKLKHTAKYLLRISITFH